MITGIQNCPAFKGVVIKSNSKTDKNIKKMVEVIESKENQDLPYLGYKESEIIKNALKEGLDSLNDEFTDDNTTRYLTFNPEYDEVTGIPFGYNLGIVNEDGSLFASGRANIPYASTAALRFAFENLKTDYENHLYTQAIEQYAKIAKMRE